MTDPSVLLSRLRDDLCLPLLRAIGPMAPDLADALLAAPLFVVTTDPAAVEVLGFGADGPLTIRTFSAAELSETGTHTIAAFIEGGLAILAHDARADVLALLAGGGGQLVVSFRPDKGEATCTLVARCDLAEPVVLFRLQSSAGTSH